MTYPGRVVTAAAVLGGALLLWTVRDLMLLVFGGIVFAVVLASLARLLRRRLPIGRRASIAASVALVAASMVMLGLSCRRCPARLD
jgi:predicted PurR-regulated permease PerM